MLDVEHVATTFSYIYPSRYWSFAMRAEPIRARRAIYSHLHTNRSPCFPIRVTRRLRELLRNEDGPPAVDYANMMGLVLIACIAAIGSLGTATAGSFDNMVDRLRETIPEM